MLLHPKNIWLGIQLSNSECMTHTQKEAVKLNYKAWLGCCFICNMPGVSAGFTDKYLNINLISSYIYIWMWAYWKTPEDSSESYAPSRCCKGIMPKYSRTQRSHHRGHLFCWKLCIKIQFRIYRSRWQTANGPINTCCIRSSCSGLGLYSLAILWSTPVCKFESKAGARGSDSTVGKRKQRYSNSWRWGKSQVRGGVAPSLFALLFYSSILLSALGQPIYAGGSEPWTLLADFMSDPTSGNGNIQGGKSTVLPLRHV